MPIGEIGKQLQLMTNNADFPKLLKKRFGGLKKFISSHPSRFRFGDNHNFNPLVYVADQELLAIPPPPPPSSLSSKQTSPRSSNQQQQTALAMLATAVRDLPFDVLQTALIQTLQTSQHSASLKAPSPRSLAPATTFPPNPATVAQREIGLYHYGGRESVRMENSNRNVWQSHDSDEDSSFLPLSEEVLNSRQFQPPMQLMEMYQQNPPHQQPHRQYAAVGVVNQPQQQQYFDTDDSSSRNSSSRLSPQLQQSQQPQQQLPQRLLSQPMQPQLQQNIGPPGIISQSTSSFTSQQQQQRRNNYP
eukprot:CAMPEP_0170087258 /NCGR_PEP_ID=MMETSP0019_2-20121128/21790_1 /TAXON_ID=98059 /ORGANISM="Dinobryon sp., Strain UTEXLB2267" /LENGTH=302 /DNA_ID=CAMNT_0010304837 /DNA_START=90 /DNA_END=998 /DNA_ORIENTATION=+